MNLKRKEQQNEIQKFSPPGGEPAANLGVLWQYQQVALIRAAAVSQRKQEIAEVEAYNASVLQAQSAAQAEQSGYRDGIYEGSAYGFGDVIQVSVTIQNGK